MIALKAVVGLTLTSYCFSYGWFADRWREKLLSTGKQFHCLGYTTDQYGPELPESTLVPGLVQPERRTHPAKSDSLQHFRACGYLHVNAGRHERIAQCCRRVMMAYDRDMSLLTYGRIFEEFRHLPNRIWQQSPEMRLLLARFVPSPCVGWYILRSCLLSTNIVLSRS